MEAVYPLPAFHFKVVFPDSPGEDTSFQEVTGITSEIDTESVVEGGENSFVHTLPKGVKHPNLVLKRGIASTESPLVAWCISVLDGDLSSPIEPRQINVWLMDENSEAIRNWAFANAYPVKWDVGGFNSTKNEVAIETVELSYTYSKREL